MGYPIVCMSSFLTFVRMTGALKKFLYGKKCKDITNRSECNGSGFYHDWT